MRSLIVLLASLCAAVVGLLYACTSVPAQQAGWYWNGGRWVPPTTGGTNMPVFRPPPPVIGVPRRSDCYGERCYREFHNYGGYDQRPLYDQWGNRIR